MAPRDDPRRLSRPPGARLPPDPIPPEREGAGADTRTSPQRLTDSQTSEVYNRGVAPPPPGTRWPDLSLKNESGGAARLPAGETLYSFFKTTCPACELAWPYLDRIRRLADGGSFSVLAVSQDDPVETARFSARLGVEIPTVYDPEPWTASETLGLASVPTFLLVGADGVVRDCAVGFQKNKMEELADRAARLSGRPAPELFLPGDSVPVIKPG